MLCLAPCEKESLHVAKKLIMKLSEVKKSLVGMDQVSFILPNGKNVPKHYHLTEIGNVNKKFVDCGGKVREETKVSFQLWTSIDLHHRLKSEKFAKIISTAEETIDLQDAEVEVEYQGETIQKFGLNFNGEQFVLTQTKTDCLAKEDCGVPVQKVKTKLSELASACCEPGEGCC